MTLIMSFPVPPTQAYMYGFRRRAQISRYISLCLAADQGEAQHPDRLNRSATAALVLAYYYNW